MNATARLMMARTALHVAGSAIALAAAYWLVAGAGMWMRVLVYAAAWIFSAALYFGVLYLVHHALDAFDERVRRIVRDERVGDDLRGYQRRLRYVAAWHRRRDDTQPNQREPRRR